MCCAWLKLALAVVYCMQYLRSDVCIREAMTYSDCCMQMCDSTLAVSFPSLYTKSPCVQLHYHASTYALFAYSNSSSGRAHYTDNFVPYRSPPRSHTCSIVYTTERSSEVHMPCVQYVCTMIGALTSLIEVYDATSLHTMHSKRLPATMLQLFSYISAAGSIMKHTFATTAVLIDKLTIAVLQGASMLLLVCPL
jgi:hypothetical protein